MPRPTSPRYGSPRAPPRSRTGASGQESSCSSPVESAEGAQHWRRFSRRGSEITGNPRLATDPANAILNYLYALLEAETTIACRALGLDPGLGVLHADTPSRDSLALDVMEPARPAVDRYVLDLLRDHVFRARDFKESAQGVCRIMPPLRDQLAATLPVWAAAVAPHAEATASLIAKSAGLPAPATRLTGQRRRSAHAPRAQNCVPAQCARTPMPAICAECGCDIPRDRRRCSACQAGANAARMITHQAAEDQASQPDRRSPSQRLDVRELIAARQRSHWKPAWRSAKSADTPATHRSFGG